MAVKLGSNNTKIPTGGRDRVVLGDLVELVSFPDQDFKTLRPVGDIHAAGTHWLKLKVTTKAGEVKSFSVGRTCLNVNLDGSANPNGGCPWCKIGHNARVGYYQNFIDIEEADNPPRNIRRPTAKEDKTGFKESKSTSSWTPVAVLPFPPTVAETMQKLTRKNKDKSGIIRELSDPSFGRALDISKDTRDGVSPANMWNVQKADVPMRKLTQEQLDYLLWDIPAALNSLRPNAKAALADMKETVLVLSQDEYEKLDLSEFPELAAKRKTKSSKRGKFTAEDDAPRTSNNKRRRFEEDDDDDDEQPIRRSRRAKVDDDEDEDDEAFSSSLRRRNTSSGRAKPAKRKASFNIKDIF